MSTIHILTVTGRSSLGGIPADIGRLGKLRVLDLRHNDLAGELQLTNDISRLMLQSRMPWFLLSLLFSARAGLKSQRQEYVTNTPY